MNNLKKVALTTTATLAGAAFVGANEVHADTVATSAALAEQTQAKTADQQAQSKVNAAQSAADQASNAANQAKGTLDQAQDLSLIHI